MANPKHSATLLKSKFQEPFETRNNRNYSTLIFGRGKPGVYLIKRDNKIVYVGFSASDVEKACLRHFYNYNDSHRQKRVFYPNKEGITVRITLTTAARAAKLEKALIIKLKPKDNPDKLQGYLGIIPKSCEQVLAEYEDSQVSTNKVMDEEAPF
jgi:hypothetical protein